MRASRLKRLTRMGAVSANRAQMGVVSENRSERHARRGGKKTRDHVQHRTMARLGPRPGNGRGLAAMEPEPFPFRQWGYGARRLVFARYAAQTLESPGADGFQRWLAIG